MAAFGTPRQDECPTLRIYSRDVPISLSRNPSGSGDNCQAVDCRSWTNILTENGERIVHIGWSKNGRKPTHKQSTIWQAFIGGGSGLTAPVIYHFLIKFSPKSTMTILTGK
jgi:hypothetical protein